LIWNNAICQFLACMKLGLYSFMIRCSILSTHLAKSWPQGAIMIRSRHRFSFLKAIANRMRLSIQMFRTKKHLAQQRSELLEANPSVLQAARPMRWRDHLQENDPRHSCTLEMPEFEPAALQSIGAGTWIFWVIQFPSQARKLMGYEKQAVLQQPMT